MKRPSKSALIVSGLILLGVTSSSRFPRSYITNNAFGGPDMKTLYITAGKTLYKVRTEIAGLPR
jgi:sugar lactone lactonase YvrE